MAMEIAYAVAWVLLLGLLALILKAQAEILRETRRLASTDYERTRFFKTVQHDLSESALALQDATDKLGQLVDEVDGRMLNKSLSEIEDSVRSIRGDVAEVANTAAEVSVELASRRHGL